MPTFRELLLCAALVAGAGSACSKHSGLPVVGGPLPTYRGSGDIGNVIATMHGDTAYVTFDPIAGAKDYRVYPAPVGMDVDAGTPIPNAIYRCAGDREAPVVPTDAEAQVPGGAVHTWVNSSVQGFTRTTADATLGYVYPTDGVGRIPIYALGDPGYDADNLCYFQRWTESRVKKYVATASERSTLLAAGWRDDGIAFYAPADGTPGTQLISTAVVPAISGATGARLYFGPGAEQNARAALSPSAAFSALTAAAAGTVPLMRVYYENGCGRSHDELVAGQARFDHAVHQGNTPIPALTWSGLTGPTTLVIEALDTGCPFQGHLSPTSVPAINGHQAYYSLADIQAAAPNGEVYVNGQHPAGTAAPRSIARSFVTVSPAAPPALDFHDGFDDGKSPGPLTELASPLYQSKRFDSPAYDITVWSVDFPDFAIGQMFGELWVTFADWAADTNGKIRITPKLKANMASDAYLYVTMEVDSVTTTRRYPQILISDRDYPIQPALPQGMTLVVQTFDEYPPRIDIELCDHRIWEVNNQCPHFTTQPIQGDPAKPALPPHAEVGDRTGVDRRNQFEVYASTDKVYVLLDGAPWGCAILPPGKMPGGPVTVTYGDVLYHSAVDVSDPPFTFHHQHMLLETRRHFDELGFRSGVAPPNWDEGRLPCASTLK
jgi:hypothetical protein